MGGFDLILAAALCLNCTNITNNATTLPPNLILPSSFSSLSPTDVSDEMVTDATPTERNIESLRIKNAKMQELRDYVNGRHLRIATIEDYPLSYTKIVNGTRIGKGVSFQVIDFLREKYNFTYEVIVPSKNIIGSTDDFSGSLVELLNNSDVDIAAAFVPILFDARHYVFYSATSLDEGEWIMVMQRPKASATGSGLLSPFEFWVWILIIVSILTVGPIIYLLIILRNKLTGDTEQKAYSLSHCTWFVYGALMKQGSTLSPIADSTRMLFATWWIFITILTAFYTANLTAFLTLSKFTLPFNTVEEILYKQKQFVTLRGSGVEYAIRGTNESLAMLYRMVRNNRAVFTKFRNDTQTLLTFVEQRGHIFIRDRPAINHVLYLDYRYRKTISENDEKIHCAFAVAKQPVLRKKRAFAYPQNSKLSQLFDPELLNLVESGIIKYLSARNLPSAEICPQDLGGTDRQLRNTDLILTYLITLSGFATAFVVFVTEILFRYLSQRCQNYHQCRDHSVDAIKSGPFISTRWAQKNDHVNNDYLNKMNRNNAINLNGIKSNTLNNTSKTPPPAYQSIYNFNKAGSFLAKFNNTRHWPLSNGNGLAIGKSDELNDGVGSGSDGNGVSGNGVSGVRLTDHYTDPYNLKFNMRYKSIANDQKGVRRTINGRDYFIYRTPNGQSQLIPVRVPSAALFQYPFKE